MAWSNSESSDIEEIEIPTLVLPYDYEPPTMTSAECYSDSDESWDAEENVDDTDGPNRDVTNWYVKM